jgi:hypothetical protein
VRRAVETPSSHDDRQFVLTLNDDRLGSKRVETGRSFQLIAARSFVTAGSQ